MSTTHIRHSNWCICHNGVYCRLQYGWKIFTQINTGHYFPRYFAKMNIERENSFKKMSQVSEKINDKLLRDKCWIKKKSCAWMFGITSITRYSSRSRALRFYFRFVKWIFSFNFTEKHHGRKNVPTLKTQSHSSIRMENVLNFFRDRIFRFPTYLLTVGTNETTLIYGCLCIEKSSIFRENDSIVNLFFGLYHNRS